MKDTWLQLNVFNCLSPWQYIKEFVNTSDSLLMLLRLEWLSFFGTTGYIPLLGDPGGN